MPNDTTSDAGFGAQGTQDFGAAVGAPAPTPETGTPPNVQDGGTGGSHDTPSGQTAPVTQPAAAPQQSQADIIKATVDATTNALMRQQQAQAPAAADAKELSTEEFNRKFGVVQVTPDHITALLDQDPKKGAATLNGLIQNTVRQAVLMALEVADGKISDVSSKFEPHINTWQSYHREVQAKAAEERFFKAHPALASERELVMEMKDAFIAKVQAGQIRFSSEQEAFSAVANAVNSILTKVRGGANGGQAAQTQTGQTQHRQMSAASSAGRTGTGQAAAKNVVDEIFGVDAR